MRIHELAKKFNVASKEILTFLKAEGADVKNHMSALTDDYIKKVESKFGKSKSAKTSNNTKEKAKKTVKKTPAKKVTQKSLRKLAETKEKPKEEKPVIGDVIKDDIPLSKEEEIAEVYTESLHEKKKSHSKLSKDDKKHKEDIVIEKEEVKKDLKIEGKVLIEHKPTVKEFAEAIGMSTNDLISKLFSMGAMATINQSLDDDTIEIIAHEINVEIEFKEDELAVVEKSDLSILEDEPNIVLEPRSPVVTFMGHVDHGKTSLLDKVRKTDVASGESGGITQHIGASTVDTEKGRIVFLDTPGHEAFTAMRSMGANVTDIVVLVVAADDGLMPQTIEAIDHSRDAEVPIIVAINKMDKADADSEKVKRQLAERNLTPEEWGGDIICVNVSALTGDGIDNLLDMILLQAEILELKASAKGMTLGIILESEVNERIGVIATAVIKNGTLKRGDPIICGAYYGKVKRMLDDKGKVLDSAGPSTPVKIMGLNGAPESGTQLRVVEAEKKARDLSAIEMLKKRHQNLEKKDIVTLENIYSQIEEGKKKDFKIILKADVSGSVHALASSLEKIKSDKINIKIIHKTTGSINDSDIMLADASKAIILGFHVSVVPSAVDMAKARQVEYKIYEVIYTALDEVRKAMEGMLEPEIQERTIGKADVKQKFKVSKLGFIAGCVVMEGKALATSYARLFRDGEVVESEKKITSLKHFAEDVKEVKAGSECGVRLEDYDDYREGDVLEFFEKVSVKQTL
ncbi:MAG: translation initiation factor IF-2 [Candidatus Aureabacteria bacterium]|nr:translation initiation factor IF-2 [Candidatus Auribacterota bacterium]